MRFLTLTALMTSALALAAPAHAETLTEALAKAYTTNPELESARANLRATDELAPQARSNFRPSVAAEAGITYSSEENKAFADDDYTSRTLGISVQQPIYRGGRTLAAMRIADKAIAAERARLKNAEQDVLLRGIEAYLNVQRDLEVLKLNENNEAVLRRQLRATRDRFNVGEVTRTDVSQAEARLSSATAARVQAEGDVTSSKAAYQRLFGEAPGDLKPADIKPTLPATLDELVTAAEENNPSVVAADNSRGVADAQLDSVKGERLPTVTGQAGVSRSYDAGSSNNGRQDVASIGLSMNWQLYTGGATSSRIREARQNLSRSSSDYDATQRSAVQVAIQSWEQYQTARATVVSRKSQVSAAQIALDGVRQEASVGNRTVLDTLNAEQELLDARVGLVRAEHDEILAQFQVLAAAGRLDARELQLPVEYYDETAYSNRVRDQWIGSGE